MTLKSGSGVNQSHGKLYRSIVCLLFPISVLSAKMHQYGLWKVTWPWTRVRGHSMLLEINVIPQVVYDILYCLIQTSRSLILMCVESALCNFVLVINGNFGRFPYTFRDIDGFIYKIACFPHPTIVWCHHLVQECLALSTYCIHRWKVHLVGDNFVVDTTGLSLFI